MSTSKPVLFSGIQPTGGGIMLGNYLGALKPWQSLVDRFDSLFCIVNLHAITVKQDPQVLKEQTYQMAATYLACGLDPKKSTIFVQSHVPEHAELAWVLTCQSYMGELSRMTQFKDKSVKNQNVATGLYTYPVLMAADILLYQAELVPVGSDQKQHLELARDLAIRVNNQFPKPLFKVPEVYIPPVGARVMSLQNPEKKMSKSDEDTFATVYLMDSDEVIVKKFKRAVTDSLNAIAYSDAQPGLKTLLDIQAGISGQSIEQLLAGLEGKQYGYLKQQTADMVLALFSPLRAEVQRLMTDKAELDRILKDSAERARARAQLTLRSVYEAFGL